MSIMDGIKLWLGKLIVDILPLLTIVFICLIAFLVLAVYEKLKGKKNE